MCAKPLAPSWRRCENISCCYDALAYNSAMTLYEHILFFEAARIATAGRWL